MARRRGIASGLAIGGTKGPPGHAEHKEYLLGLALGAVTGALTGPLVNIGIDDFIRQTRDSAVPAGRKRREEAQLRELFA